MLLMMKQADPTLKLIQNLLSRPPNDFFTTCSLKVLLDDSDNMDQVSNHLANVIKKLITSGEIYPASSTKEKSPKKTLCLDLVLSHLDTFRLNCIAKEARRGEMLLSSAPLQEAFTMVKKSEKSSDLRLKYTELFAVIEIFSDAETKQRPLRKTRQTRTEAEVSMINRLQLIYF